MANMTLDTYTLRARVQPSLLIVLPLAMVVLASIPGGLPDLKLLWGLIVGSGGLGLMSQLGRDWGRRKQARLFETWGGPPTSRMLRHKDLTNAQILRRRHGRLQELLPDLHIPSPEEEQNDPEKADQVYEACVSYLRTATRDRNKFPLVFEENMNYGFRRNLWAMKPIGIAMTVLGIAGVVSLFAIEYAVAGTPSWYVPIIAVGLNVGLLVAWVFAITPDWVRTAANAYAERLLETTDTL